MGNINSVQGNTRDAQGHATTQRQESKGKWSANVYNFSFLLILIVVGVTIAKADLSVFWQYVFAASMIIAGTKLNLDSIDTNNNTKLWKWHQYIKIIGFIVLGATITSSGVGKWAENAIVKLDAAAACAADKKCVEEQKRKKEEEKRRKEEERLSQLKKSTIVTRPLLDKGDFTTMSFGSFRKFQVKKGAWIGPVNQYDGSCMYAVVSGFGKLQVHSRPDFTSKPVAARMSPNNVGVESWGHQGPAYQLFYKAVDGNIQLELERRKGNNSCK